MNIDDIDEMVTEIANSIFGSKSAKAKAQLALMRIICIACETYEKDKNFRQEIDFLRLYLNNLKN